MENPPKKYFRLSPNTEVRLKDAYYIKCNKIIKNENDCIIEIQCTYDPKTKGGWSDDGRKVKGTIQWVSIQHSINASICLYNRLFKNEDPLSNENFLDSINSDSLEIHKNCKLEPSLANAKLHDKFQFLRHGYFVLDKTSSKSNLIFNQSVGLRDSWAKKSIKS